jgi:glucan biosynthesis protein C
LHALDQLRAIAMLVGVLFHAALAYSPLMAPYWPTAADRNWSGVDALVWLPHLMRMPLFFLVSGYFAAMLLERRGMGGLMRQRVRRILLPFLVAWPLVHLAVSAMTGWAAASVAQPSPFLVAVREYLAMPDPPDVPLMTGHLWFLWYLLVLTVLLWVWRSLELGPMIERRWPGGAIAGIVILPLLVWPGFMLTAAPHPAPESLFPQFWALLVYGPFFALGVALCGRLDELAPLQRWLLPGTLVCLGLYLVFLRALGAGPFAPTAPWPVAALEALIAAWGTLLCFIAGLRWLARPHRWLDALSRSAYWTYLLHLPIVFGIQYLLLDVDAPWPLEFLGTVVATLLVCITSHALLVQRTALRRYVG